MTPTERPDARPELAIHVAAIVAVGVLAVGLVLLLPQGASEPDRVAQASPVASATTAAPVPTPSPPVTATAMPAPLTATATPTAAATATPPRPTAPPVPTSAVPSADRASPVARSSPAATPRPSPARQVIVVTTPSRAVVGDGPLRLEATSSSGLLVAVTVEGPCTLADGRLTVTGAGTCTITARQAGDARWAAAAPVVRELVIASVSQSITFEPLEGMVLGDRATELDAAATSGLPVVFSTQGPCEIADGGRLLPTGAGLCAVTASQPGDHRYAAAEDVQRVFRIGRAAQRITFTALDDLSVTGPPIELSATASSGLPVVFGATGACELEAPTRLRPSSVGACTVTAYQAGDADWAPAPDVAWTIAVVEPSEPAPSPTTG